MKFNVSGDINYKFLTIWALLSFYKEMIHIHIKNNSKRANMIILGLLKRENILPCTQYKDWWDKTGDTKLYSWGEGRKGNVSPVPRYHL